MSRSNEQHAPLPSWRTPILVGAATTLLLHVPAVFDNVLWFLLLGALGITGVPTGALTVVLALRRERDLGAGNGFRVAFLAAGSCMLGLALATVIGGMRVTPEQYEELRTGLVEGGESQKHAAELVGQLQDHPLGSVVAAAGMVAMCSGITGALVAAWRGRKRLVSPELRPPAPPSA